MNLHISMIIISFITSLTIIKAFTYLKILSINLNLASEPAIKEKINSKAANTAFNIAANQFHTWKKIWFPLSIASLLGSFIIWILFSLDIQPTDIELLISTLTISISWAKILPTNLKQQWLYDWTILLQSAKDEVNLEYLQQRLQFIRQQLQDVINGKQISPSELYQLKYEGLYLSKEAEQYKIKKGQ